MLTSGDQFGRAERDQEGEGCPAAVQRHPRVIRQRTNQQKRQLFQIWKVHGHQL